MARKKDEWDELDSQLDEKTYSIVDWSQFFEALMNKEIPINSKPVFGNLTAKDIVRLQERLLLDFKKDLDALEQIKIKPKLAARTKVKNKYRQLQEEAERTLKQFKEFLERSLKND
jgi:hypothetical protein